MTEINKLHDTEDTSYEFSYELKSKQLRRYKVNSLPSIRRAISANLQDYFSFQGIKENEFHLWSNFPYFLIILVGSLIIHQWYYKVDSSFLFWERILFYLLFVFQRFWNNKFEIDDLIFEGTGSVIVNENTSETAKLLGETNKTIRVFLEFFPERNIVTIKMQLVKVEGIFPKKYPLLCGVEQRVNYGRYFSEQGFFYGTFFVNDIDLLFKRLLQRYLR